MLEIALSRFAQSDVGPMRAAPFAVFTAENSQEQRPILLLVVAGVGRKRGFPHGWRAPSCSFAAFNSGISARISLLHTSGKLSLSVLRV
jgi:hypothetical protein